MKRHKYGIQLLPAAEEDLNDIVTYIAADNRTAAQSVATKIEKNLRNLASRPYLGRIPKDEDLARPGYRFLIVESYLIFYTIEEKTIWVHRMIHGARNYLNLL